MAESVHIEGLKEAAAALAELDVKLQRSIVRKATRAGATVVLNAARAEAPSRTGATRANTKIRAGRSSKGVFGLTVGVGAKDFTGDQFYAAFVLYGHKVGSRRLGDARRSVAANNWLGRALDESGPAAAETLADNIVTGIELEARQHG